MPSPNGITRDERFFLEPQRPRQRQYEALRAYFVDGWPSAVAAAGFGYTAGAFRVLCHKFRRGALGDFFRDIPRGPQVQTKKDPARPLIVALRKQNLSIYDIQDALTQQGHPLSLTAIHEVLRAEGFARLPRRRDEERPQRPRPERAAVARTVQLDVPHRLYQTPKVIDQRVRLRDSPAPLRQLFVKDLGHEQPTVLLTNDLRAPPAALLIRYARRMLIENGLADAVNFLHLDALSSAVALNVSFDVLLTVIATGLYRLLALKLRGFERAQPRQIWRRFLKSPAHVRVTEDEVVVELPRRAHNPILIASGLLDDRTPVPWWNGRSLRFEIP